MLPETTPGYCGMRKASGRNHESATARWQRLPALLAASLLLGSLPASLVAQDAVAVRTNVNAPAYKSVDELIELDEVVVQGTRLQDRIVKAEDRFFKLYNELNKNNDYDVNCAYLPLEQDTRIDSRLCAPAFYANAIVDELVWQERCRGSQDSEGNYVPPPPCYTPPPPDLVLLDRSNDYAKNLMSVIRSDPRLQEMAGELDDLHRERARLANRYREIKTIEDEARAAQPRYRPKIR